MHFFFWFSLSFLQNYMYIVIMSLQCTHINQRDFELPLIVAWDMIIGWCLIPSWSSILCIVKTFRSMFSESRGLIEFKWIFNYLYQCHLIGNTQNRVFIWLHRRFHTSLEDDFVQSDLFCLNKLYSLSTLHPSAFLHVFCCCCFFSFESLRTRFNLSTCSLIFGYL